MVKFIIASSLFATLAVPATARLTAVTNDFNAQVKDLLKTSPMPPDNSCERGLDANKPCAAGEFCQLNKYHASTCPSTENRLFVGTCIAIPQICATIWAPVCGCDDVTYGSECKANAMQVDIKHQGECVVPCQAIYAPVCGCDGITYDNDCLAGAAGTTVCSQGECQQAVACPLNYAPVCGCDMNTYDNECLAEAAGVEVCNDKLGCQPCPKNIAHVCCGNGYTYNNSCIARNFGANDCTVGQCPPGASYCTYSPDEECYPSSHGWPACCSDEYGGASCPTEKPACESESM